MISVLSKSPTTNKQSSKGTTDAFILTSRLYEKQLDDKNPKIDHTKEIFGKPHVFVQGKKSTAINEAILSELID